MPLASFQDNLAWAAARLEATEPLKVTSELTNLTELHVVPRLFANNKKLLTNNIDRYSELADIEDFTGNTAFVGLDHVNQASISNQLKKILIDLKYLQTSWAIDDREEDVDTRRKLLNLQKQRRLKAMIAQMEAIEAAFFQLPENTLSPVSLPYYVVHNSGSAQAFSGQNPTGFNDVAGLDTSLPENARYRNWSDNYNQRNPEDLFEKMAIAAQETNFVAPATDDQQRDLTGKQNIYTTKHNEILMRRVIRDQNDNLGFDVGYEQNGRATFQMQPIIAIPALTSPTSRTTMANADLPTHPVYMIQHASFFPVVSRKYWMKITGPIRLENQHHRYAFHMESYYSIFCRSRRRQAVLGYV